MSEPIIIADGYSAEPYGDGYIISHRDGGRRTAELDMAAAVREIARLRAALAAQVPQWKAVVDAAREAMEESFEAGNEAMDISIPAHHAAALSLRLDEFDAATGAPPPPAALAVPAGMALVPVEPTIAMCIAGDEARHNADDSTRTPAIYRAMLAASQQAAVAGQDDQP